jgi:hypothetical protein
MALSAFGRILLVSRACAVELSVWVGVYICVWPSSLSNLHIDTFVLALINSAPSLASAAEGHYCPYYLQYVEYRAIVGWDFLLSCHEHVSAGLAASFQFVQIGGIAMNCKYHVAGFVKKYARRYLYLTF